VPYVLVLGQKEAEAQSASVRSRAKGDEGVHKVDDLLARFASEVATRALPERKKV
jgi:threonyl-tRNA synthetase